MTISVAVATCGRPQALADCLRAIAQQSRTPDQLIVVQQDPSPEAAEVVRASGLKIDYIIQDRLGLSASRNLALAKARADVLAVTDDDCSPDAGWCAALVSALQAVPAPAAVTGPILPPLGAAPEGMHGISLRPSRTSRTYDARTTPWHVGSGANFAAGVDLLRQTGGWDERLGVGTAGHAAEDIELIDRILRAGKTIHYEQAAVVRHAWQTAQRRESTHWSYGYGIGALCGLRLRERDRFAVTMLASYSRRRLSRLIAAAARLDLNDARGRMKALSALVPGCIYGLRAAPRQAQPSFRTGQLD